MEIFKINDNTEIVCEWKKTRNAFKHEAVLLVGGKEVDRTKINYLNRTWEQFDFESVLQKLLEKTNIVEKEAIKPLLDAWAKDPNINGLAELGFIGAIAKMGEIFGQTKQETNDWKARMLKAGLAGKGLIMPEDWDTLTENEKELRLNGAIAQLG